MVEKGAVAHAAPVPVGSWTGTRWALAGAVVGIGLTMGLRAPTVNEPATAAAVAAPIIQVPAEPAPIAAGLSALAERLAAVDDLMVSQRGAVLAATPRSSIFPSGSVALGVRERRLVGRIGEHLAAEPLPLHIEIRGHTDGAAIRAGAAWTSNWALGLDRARAVALVLGANRGTSPAHAIALASAGEAPPGVPDAAVANRTVVILITRAEGGGQ
jgi:flagellar motor protein MotB